MSTFGLKRGRHRLHANLSMLIAIGIAFIGYMFFLHYEDGLAKAHYAELRTENPDLYLAEVRRGRGFGTFLEEFREIKSYGEYKPLVPPFLLGRWALFEKPKRVSALYFPETCVDSVEIEDGRIRGLGKYEGNFPVRYRMAGESVLVSLPDSRDMPIDLVSYGANLQHIELQLPNSGRTLYGYLCK